MARSKINPEDTDIEVPSSQATSTQLATQQSAEVEHYDPEYYDDTSRDVEVPALGLVNGIGPLAKQFRNQAGNFVLGEQVLGPKVDVIPVAVVKYFAERFRDGVELKPGSAAAATRKIFATASDAAKAGYVVDFNNKAPNRVEEAARIGYLVLAPEGADLIDFALKAPGGLRLARAKCTYQRGGFRNVFRKVFDYANKVALLKDIPTRGLSHSQLFEKAQAWNGVWTLTPEECSGNDNTWFEPRISKKVALTDEQLTWVTENYGNVRA